MHALASKWLCNEAGELLLTAQNGLQLVVWCGECQHHVEAVPGVVLLRSSGDMEAIMMCPVPEHGPLYPWVFLPKLPQGYCVVDGRIEREESEPTPEKEY